MSATTFTGYLTFGPSTESQLTFNFTGFIYHFLEVFGKIKIDQNFCNDTDYQIGLTVFQNIQLVKTSNLNILCKAGFR